jgi:hypothetical protein
MFSDQMGRQFKPNMQPFWVPGKPGGHEIQDLPSSTPPPKIIILDPENRLDAALIRFGERSLKASTGIKAEPRKNAACVRAPYARPQEGRAGTPARQVARRRGLARKKSRKEGAQTAKDEPPLRLRGKATIMRAVFPAGHAYWQTCRPH